MMNRRYLKKGILACTIGGLCAAQVHAVDFYFGNANQTSIQVNSQLSVGASWRTEDASSKLVDGSNSGSGFSSTSDDGNQNFSKGDAFSQIFKGSHDIQITRGNIGGFTRFKYWTDAELENGNRAHGNSGSSYEQGQPLSDSGFSDNAKFTGVTLLDAYVYGSFDVADMPLDIRLGRQVLSWGESTFIQGGMNSSNPFDVSALRRPGATLKEGILPVGMAMINMGISEDLSVEAFYQYEWAKTEVDGCGTLFGVDIVASGCDFLTIGSSAPAELGGPFNDAQAQDAGFYASRKSDVDAKDSGQYGLAVRYYAQALNDTEFGVYFMNIHSRLPLLSALRTTFPGTTIGATSTPFIPSGHPDPATAAASIYNGAYQVEFPEDLKFYGLSFATNISGLALSGEISYKPDTPIQINGSHLLAAVLREDITITPVAQRIINTEAGGVAKGYDEFDVTQVQVTAIKFMERVLGASRLTLVGEVGGTYIDGIENSTFVYGRDPVFGIGQASDGGHVTKNAWGYRGKASLNYSDVYAGIALTPTVSWSHDVEGYSPAPAQQFLEGRQSLGLSIDASYQQTYSAALAYQQFRGGDYNTNTDKDFASISFSVLY